MDRGTAVLGTVSSTGRRPCMEAATASVRSTRDQFRVLDAAADVEASPTRLRTITNEVDGEGRGRVDPLGERVWIGRQRPSTQRDSGIRIINVEQQIHWVALTR